MEMVIRNLNIDTQLVADAQEYGGMHNRIVGIFWSCKYATKGRWISAPYNMTLEGYYLDNAIWMMKLKVNPSWNITFQDIADSIRTVVGDGKWTL